MANLTPEQEHLREETIKWLQKFNNQTPFCGIHFYTNAADSLLTIQQAAGAVLKDSDQYLPSNPYNDNINYLTDKGYGLYLGFAHGQKDLIEQQGFVKVQPLTGGK